MDNGSEKEEAAAEAATASLEVSGSASSTSVPTLSYAQRRKQRNQTMQRQQEAQLSDETLQHGNTAEAAASTIQFPPPPPLTNGVFSGIKKQVDAAQSTTTTSTTMTSSGEENTTAAPTPAPAGPAPPPHHRGVSWGGVEEFNASEPTTDSSTHPSSPAASTRSAQEVYEAAEAAMEQQEGSRMQHFKGLSSMGKINLDDLMQLHPMESEAETHILRALEQSDIAEGMAVNADGIISGEVSLLGHVPEGAEGIFSSPPPSELDGTSDHHQHSTRMRGISIGAYGDDDDQDAPASYTTPVVDSVWNHISEPTAAVSSLHSSNTSMRFSQQHRYQANSNNSVGTGYLHRRQKTMEQTLSTLTNALDDLHWHNRARASTIDSKPAPSVNHEHVEPLESSADAFAKNVSVLFRNKTTGTATPNLTTEVEPLIAPAGATTGSERNHGSAAVVGDNSSSHNDVDESPSEQGDEESQECSSSHFTPPLTPGRSTKARKNWSVLKDAIIENGLAAALDVGMVHSAGDDNTSGHAMSTINEDADDIEMGDSGGTGGGSPPNNLKPSTIGPKLGWLRRMANRVGFVRDIDDFLQPRRESIWVFIKAVLWVSLPSLGVAFILYYLGDNPPTGTVDRTSGVLVDENGELVDPTHASASWWLLFIGVRQLVTFSMARFMEGFLVDFICLERRWSLSCFGPTFTLLIVQSKGWPCILFFWSLFDLALLYGEHPLAAHWGYFQSYLPIFNDSNPSGEIVSSALNLRIILLVLAVSCAVAIKRLLIGYHFGRKLFGYYAEDLARVIKKILLISQVASLASQLERERIFEGDQQRESANVKARRAGIDEVVEEEAGHEDNDKDETNSQGSASVPHSAKSLLIGERNEDGSPDGVFTQAQKNRIDRLLGNWDEPDAAPYVVAGNISIASILQFRTSMTQLGRPFPFSFAFGRASTREECIESSQNVYQRLLAETPGETSLSFNVVALVALQSDGTLVPEKVRDLIRLFRPNRNGSLTMFDFIRSVDAVYKELRLLRASVRNAQKLDQSFERIFNVVFYIVIFFMISRASSNYFEGLLFILARRPYDIGDRIVVQPVEGETSMHGTTDWIVKDIDLFTTTISSAFTNEVATVSNGSMANSRIMNGARSPSALLYIILRFGIDVTYGQLEIFREALTRYCEARPREWTKMWCFRCITVQADAGYVEYMVCVEARDSWQELFHLWHIRGQIKAFCHELSKQLDMRYVSPPMPIDLRMRGSLDDALREDQARARAREGITADSEVIQSIIQDRRR